MAVRGLDISEFRAAIRRCLSRLFQIHGRGSRQRALAAAGISPSTLDSALARGSLKIVPLALILEALGTNLAEFFAEVLGHKLQGNKPMGPAPPIMQTVRDRLKSESWSDRLSPEDRIWLEEMSWQSVENPRQVDRWLVEEIRGERSLSPLLFGVYGSCLCRLGRYREARWILDLGFEGAEQLGRWHDLAMLHQRLAWVEYHEGDRQKALERLAVAGSLFYDLGDVQALSQTAIERGVLLAFLGDYDFAAKTLEQGTRGLGAPGQSRGKEETLYRFSAYRFLTLCHLELGRIREAEESLRQAKEYVPGGEDRAMLLLRSLEVEILERKKWFKAAARHHRELAEEYCARNQSEDAVLEGLSSLRCYLKEELMKEATGQLQFLFSLVFRLDRSDARAYTNFVTAAVEGAIDREELCVLEKRLKKDREDHLEKKFFIGLY